MAGNVKSGSKKVCPLTSEELETAWFEYLDISDNAGRAPSLPDYLGYVNRKHRTRLTENSVKIMLQSGEEGRSNTYNPHREALEAVLMALRGEYLSNPRWSGQSSAKAMLALSKDYGDGIIYSSKEAAQKGPEALQILFGDGDPRANKAAD